MEICYFPKTTEVKMWVLLKSSVTVLVFLHPNKIFLLYLVFFHLAGMPISDVLQKNVGIGGVISLLWFQRCLPPYVCKFFEMCLMVTADHGPAVSGAHNTIVCARAGKDLVSSLVSGLLTIGDRFGGALDGAAKTFSDAYDKGNFQH